VVEAKKGSTSGPEARTTGAAFAAQLPSTGGESDSPTQLPLQHWLFHAQVSPAFGRHAAPLRQWASTQVIVKLQSSLVRQMPPSTAFATHTPATQP
jgi:hypothetical protein